MTLFLIGTLQDAWIGPDLLWTNVTEGTMCWQSDYAFEETKRERGVRWSLGVASEVFSGLGALWYVSSLELNEFSF